MTDTAVYLYGVARGLETTALGDAEGVAGSPVRTVRAGDLTALVSTVPLEEYSEAALRANLEDLAWLEATARAHHGVVDRAARAAPTAPVRIATLYRDDARVAEVLAAQRDQFTQVLDSVTGRSEWGVKAYAGPEALRAAQGPAADDPGPGAGAPPEPAGAGTAYLRRRQSERRQREDAGRRLAERASAIHAELADHAVAVRHHPPQDPRLSGHDAVTMLNVAYLLDDEQVEGFLAVAGALRDRLPEIDLEVTGPWPPYSFIDTVDTAPRDSAVNDNAAGNAGRRSDSGAGAGGAR